MEFKISFDVNGRLAQFVEIEEEYLSLFTEDNLNDGKILTTIAPSGEIYYIGDRNLLTIGKVIDQSVDSYTERGDYTPFVEYYAR